MASTDILQIALEPGLANWGRGNCAGAVYDCLAPTKNAIRPPGQWNRYQITCQGSRIAVVLNGEQVIDMDMRLFTSAETNPDGSAVPAWLSRPVAGLATRGHIGLQGKHGEAPIWFRNLKIQRLNP